METETLIPLGNKPTRAVSTHAKQCVVCGSTPDNLS